MMTRQEAETMDMPGAEGQLYPDPVNVGKFERAGSVILGALLMAVAVRRRSWLSVLPALAGVALVNRGFSGRCSVYKKLDINTARSRPRRYETSVYGNVVIKASASQLYDAWRDPQNFPRFFEPFARIMVTSTESSHWVVKAPFGRQFEWDAWITEERRGEVIRWESSDDSQLPNHGLLRFRPAPGDGETEVILELHFAPSGGVIGKKLADFLRLIPRSMAQQALRRFKTFVETGEVFHLEENSREGQEHLYENIARGRH